MKNDIIVESFNWAEIQKTFCPLITVYYNTTDYPDKYVARLWNMNKPTEKLAIADTLEDIRKAIPKEMVLCKRREEDDPVIVEVYI